VKQYLKDSWLNTQARFQLFKHRLVHGLMKEEYDEIILSQVNRIKKSCHRFLEKVVLVPTAWDRFQLVNELFVDHWKAIVGVTATLKVTFVF
jgi:hypothetical protein